MAKFVFHLEGVLRQRQAVEQQRQREIALIQAQMSASDAQLRALDEEMKFAERDLRENRLVGRLDLAFLAAHRRFALAMQRKAMGIAQKMAVIQVQLDEARQKLTEAAKNRKVIEKLKERQLLRWREQVSRHEMAEMDEIATQISYRNLVDDQRSGA
jgi:flagellar FliJ protein